MPATPPYLTIVQKDAGNQKFYLVVVDSLGAEQPQFGKVAVTLADIRALAAGATTPVVDANDVSTVKFREVVVLDKNGKQNTAIVLAGGAYNQKPNVASGGGYAGTYDRGNAYTAGQIVRVEAVITVGGIKSRVGVFGCVKNVPANGTGNQIPQFPEPSSGDVYWHLISLGVNAISACTNGTVTIYIQSSDPF